MLPTFYARKGAHALDTDSLPTVGGGRLDEIALEAGPGMALLATDRGVCGLARWDADQGVAYDDDSDRYVLGGEERCKVSDGTPLSMARGTTLVVVRRVGDAPVAAKRKRVSR